MKVILPVIEKEIVAEGFRNALFMCIYDSRDNSFEWLSTARLNVGDRDLGEEIKLMGVNSVISSNMTPIALQIFARNGIEVFKAKSDIVSENIAFLQNNQLELFTSQIAREIQACNNSCSSCSSKSCN